MCISCLQQRLWAIMEQPLKPKCASTIVACTEVGQPQHLSSHTACATEQCSPKARAQVGQQPQGMGKAEAAAAAQPPWYGQA